MPWTQALTFVVRIGPRAWLLSWRSSPPADEGSGDRALPAAGHSVIPGAYHERLRAWAVPGLLQRDVVDHEQDRGATRAGNDPVVLGSLDEIEGLTTGLAGKIWQKITILDRAAVAATSPPTPRPS